MSDKSFASSVEEAYSRFKNDYSGNGVYSGQLNPQGFINWSDKDNWGIASNQINPQVDIDWSNKDTWDTASNWSDSSGLGAEYGKFSENFSDLGKFINSDENQAAAFTTDAPQIVKPAASGGLAGLRVDEKEAGVVYASGAYWMDGADGKLEKIMDPDKAGWTANRAQALEIARNRLNTGGDTGESVPETAPTAVKVADPAAKQPATPFQGASLPTDKVDTTDSAEGIVKRGEAAGLWTNPENIDKDGNLKYGENRFYAPPGALF